MNIPRVTINELEENNKGNRCLLRKHNAKITLNPQTERTILYHGTRAPYRKILHEGLLIRAGLQGEDTKLKMIDDVLNREFGVTREQVPDWVWRGEYDYEKTVEPHLHMSVNIGTAIGYSHQGCEIKAQIRQHMLYWLVERRSGEMTRDEFKASFPNASPSKIARERNGRHSYVFQVAVPTSFLRREDRLLWQALVQRVNRLQKTEPESHNTLETTTLEIRCLQSIPPQMIIKTWEVKWAKNRDFEMNGESYRLIPIALTG